MPTFYEPPPSTPQRPPRYNPPSEFVRVPPKSKQPWVQDPQDYSVTTLAAEHDEALWIFGQYTMFVLMWTAIDFEADLVGRCPTCFLSQGKIADTYNQAPKERCPDCYGTTFQGGWRAKVVRPSLFAPIDIDDSYRQRGIQSDATTTLETTNDFTLHHNDYVLRGDGSRWQFQRPDADEPLTGFQTNVPVAGWNLGTVVREDESSVAYMIPPATDDLIALLDRSYIRLPLDFSTTDEIRGPL